MMKLTPGWIVFWMWLALNAYGAFQMLALLLSGEPI